MPQTDLIKRFTVNRALAEAVVGCLSWSGETCDVNVLRKFRLHDWHRTFNWLDRAGLTLYLLQRLKSMSATQLLPSPVLARLSKILPITGGALIIWPPNLVRLTNDFAVRA
jgi:hypothetical protein